MIEPMWTPATAVNPDVIVSLVGRPDPVILDIGCNDGTHTNMFLSLFPGARVFCFDPEWRARKRFVVNVKDTRAKLYATAVGAYDGQAAFYPSEGDGVLQPKDWDYSGSIRRPKNHLKVHPWCKFREHQPVSITRLDTWAQAYLVDDERIVDFIWADVQGAEIDLIQGGLATLGCTRYFFTEYSDGELYEGQVGLAKILQLLPDFEIVHQYPEDVLLRNRSL